VQQIVEFKQKANSNKDSQNPITLKKEENALPKTQFQIDRENGISVEQLKENLLKRVRQLWEK
jgi:hypothetical protein